MRADQVAPPRGESRTRGAARAATSSRGFAAEAGSASRAPSRAVPQLVADDDARRHRELEEARGRVRRRGGHPGGDPDGHGVAMEIGSRTARGGVRAVAKIPVAEGTEDIPVGKPVAVRCARKRAISPPSRLSRRRTRSSKAVALPALTPPPSPRAHPRAPGLPAHRRAGRAAHRVARGGPRLVVGGGRRGRRRRGARVRRERAHDDRARRPELRDGGGDGARREGVRDGRRSGRLPRRVQNHQRADPAVRPAACAGHPHHRSRVHGLGVRRRVHGAQAHRGVHDVQLLHAGHRPHREHRRQDALHVRRHHLLPHRVPRAERRGGGGGRAALAVLRGVVRPSPG